MQILIDHNGSDAFYTDAVNMMAQYRSLLKKPGRKVENMLQTYKLLGIAAAVFALPYWSCTSLLAYEKINAPFEPSRPRERENDLFF